MNATIESLPVESVTLDGEIIVPDEQGRSDFLRLVSALKEGQTEGLVYSVFDLLHLDGEDLRERPLRERKEKLRGLFSDREGISRRILYSDHWEGEGAPILRKGCEMGLEGIISKDASMPYVSGRGTSWIKSKCVQGQEFVIAGYTAPGGSRTGFGAVLLGAYTADREFRYVGKVGTGFGQKDILDLMKRFSKLKTSKTPFSKAVPKEKHVTWVRPELVVDIQYRGWTGDRLLRQGAYHGLRFDKPAQEVLLDVPVEPEKVEAEHPASRSAKGSTKVPSITLSNPDKVLIAEARITKKDIWDYLRVAAKWMLPQIEDRPLSLLRCPDGVEKECFFQKRLHQGTPAGVHTQKIEDQNGEPGELIYIDSEEGLLSLAQLGVLEIHTWGAHRGNHHAPDLVVFDLDPDPDVPLKQVGRTALRLKEILEQLGLTSFLKVSGGKGMHVHVPVEPRYNWDEIKAFSRAIAQQLVHENPDLYLATMTKAKRKGKIFIDYFRNGYGATSIAPYSLRARAEGTVALPIDWEDALKIKPDAYPLKKAVRLLQKRKDDPWKDYLKVRQRIALLETARG